MYKVDFDNTKPTCPCCTFNIELEECECDAQDLEDKEEEWEE